MRNSGAPIPAADRVHCVQCSELIDARGAGNAQLVHGWRINRTAGGANMIALAEPQARWLCRFCLDDRRNGRTFEQLSMFDEA